MESRSIIQSTGKPKKTTQVLQRVFSILGFLLFAMFSSLQSNDVSQYGTSLWLTDTWLIGYGLLAFVCLYNAIRPLSPKSFLVLAGITFALALYRGSQIDWSQPLFCFIAHEEFAKRNPAGNETGGLVIMTLWLLLLYWTNKRLLKSK